MLLSSERPVVGAFAFVIPGATLLLLNGLVHAVLPESKNMSKRIIGFSENLGDPVVSSANSRLELPGYQLQASAVALVRRGAKRTSAIRGTTKRRQRSAVGWAAGSHSTLIVPRKPGNWSHGTRWREGKTVRGCLMLDPGPGTTSKALYLETRITVTTQDSKPGMQRLVVWRIHHQRNRML